MRCVVTGGAGFIGSRLSARLIRLGYEVRLIDNLAEGSTGNLRDLPGVDLLDFDILDAEELGRAVRGCDVVFHHAAKRAVERSVEEPVVTTRTNIEGTVNVLEAARSAGARVVFASSSSVYGDQDELPLREDAARRPKSPYAASKSAGEDLCRAWSVSMGVPTISLRYFNVYGPFQDPHSRYAAVIPRFVLACLQGTHPVIHGDGEQARDFTYIGDVVDANLLAARADERAFGLVFNIGGGARPTTVNQLLAMVADLTGTSPEANRVPPRRGDVRRTEADISLATDLLGFRPSTSLREGLRATVDWFREVLSSNPVNKVTGATGTS